MRIQRNLFILLLGLIVLLTITIGVLLIDKYDAKSSEKAHAASQFVKSRLADGSASMTAMAFAPDGRLFFLEKRGTVRIVKNNALLATSALTLSSLNTDGERGLLGIAFDPNFATNNYLYLYYTVNTPAHNRVSRFVVNGDVVDPASETPLLDLPTLGANIHNGGALHFGTDGKLYIGVGENANGSNAASLTTTLGKILRINPDGSIPTDNPFYATATGDNRAIWAYGFRNPFTFAIQSTTGKLFVNDVGDNGDKRWEEINDVTKGNNYGWPTAWGDQGSGGDRPIYTYQTEGCAITGGTFYNPSNATFPSQYLGKYFFADYCSGWIKTIDPVTKQVALFQNYPITFPIDLQVGPDGALYVLTYSQSYDPNAPSTGYIEKIAYVDDTLQPCGVTPTIAPSPTPVGATPVSTITSPTNNDNYTAGDTINYSATGTDAEDGTLPASAFSWTIVFHHDIHTHPFLGPITGQQSGSFTIPQNGEWASNVWYRINVTVTDSSGQRHTSYVDVRPRPVSLTLATIPSGLQTSFDFVPDASPYTQTTVAGIKRTIGAAQTQTMGGKIYQFVSWSDGGSASHEITAPLANTTYTATYTEALPTPTNTPTPTPVPPTVGNGLTGVYFSNITLTGASVLTRIDPMVNFGYGTGGWGSKAPAPSLPADNFSVRWTGYVVPLYSQIYTFYTKSDDGVRLWVNGTNLVNNWTNHSSTENSGAITLQAGQRYPITMEFYDNAYDAIAELYWSSPSQAKQIIPTARLFSN